MSRRSRTPAFRAVLCFSPKKSGPDPLGAGNLSREGGKRTRQPRREPAQSGVAAVNGIKIGTRASATASPLRYRYSKGVGGLVSQQIDRRNSYNRGANLQKISLKKP
jgi:hypothetical protein